MNYDDLKTGEGIAKHLRKIGQHFGTPKCEHLEWFDLHDYDLVPDAKYRDRLKAVPKPNMMVHPIDLSHRRIYSMPGQPIWEPIKVAPFYLTLPEGEVLATNSLGYATGTKLRLTADASYFGGEVWPTGTVITVAGFKTTLYLIQGRMGIAFSQEAQFPDGTYRHAPATSEVVA